MKALKDWGLAIAVGLAVFLLAEWLSARNLPEGTAPDFELVNPAGGTVQLSALRGRPVVLNFWGTWCPPCIREIPEFSAFATEHPDVAVLGIAQGSGSGAQLTDAAQRLGITYTVLESDRAVLDAYGIDAFPTTLVLRADGTIAQSFQGGINKKTLERAVDLAAD